jgi:drug/metabolite transporter superfamily protein YnfA
MTNARFLISAVLSLIIVALVGVMTLNAVPDGWPTVAAFGGLVLLWALLWSGILWALDSLRLP